MTRIALLLALLLPFAACAAPPADLVEGVHYETLPQPGTFLPVKKGEVEIVEVFAYTCSHCATFAPKLDAWKATLPKNVVVRYTPPGYNLGEPLSRAYFASEELGALGLTHLNTFDALHDAHTLPMNATDGEVASYYGTLGVDAAKFQAAMDGPKVMQRMQAARNFALRIGLKGTPTLIVAGKYRVLGDTIDDVLRIARELAIHPPQ
jgi:protein dithiol oxidoreductase (disulfide-forming)